jgi:hypothetical protein
VSPSGACRVAFARIKFLTALAVHDAVTNVHYPARCKKARAVSTTGGRALTICRVRLEPTTAALPQIQPGNKQISSADVFATLSMFSLSNFIEKNLSFHREKLDLVGFHLNSSLKSNLRSLDP